MNDNLSGAGISAGPRTLRLMPAGQQAGLDPYMAQIVTYRKSGLSLELPAVFRTGNLRLFHAASCPFRYSSRTSCGVRYPSVEWRRVLL